ncbi:MAG: AbgT family transporter [Bacteroidales bacterium]|jgi:uncharacterized ion transporter superfamily protein YfcC|nr:AbgT family transporter [Bacteroidales bacterium]
MKHKFKIPHTFTIVFFIVIGCAVLTWFIPGGQFNRETVEIEGVARNIVVSDSFHNIDHEPQTWQIFTALYKGFVKTSNIIIFILMIGGAFWIMNATKAIDLGIMAFLNSCSKLQRYKFFQKIGVNNLVIILIMIMFSLFGAIFGMSEETIAFIIIFVPLAISMGYDSITGILICYVAAHIGFTGAMLNPFTIGIAQGLSGLQPFSGIEYRFVCWLILTTLIIIFTLIYASRVKKKPERSPMYKLDEYWRNKSSEISNEEEHQRPSLSAKLVFAAISAIFICYAITMHHSELTMGTHQYDIILFPIIAVGFIIMGFFTVRKSTSNFILTILLFTIIMLITGVLCYQWYVMEISGLFFAMGIATGFAYSFKFDKIIRLFLEGCKDILVAAIVVGIAGGIIIILEDGKIIDTILYAVSQTMVNSGKEGAVGAMYVIQNLINILIPSGSAKAALTIPMMAEFSDLIGVSRQLTVLAFQFGDGFTNMITPTSGVLIGVLGIARVPYGKWLKFFLPIVLVFILIGFLLLLPPLYFNIVQF